MKYFIETDDINLIIDSLSFTSRLLDKYQLDIKHFYAENDHVIWTQKDIDY